MLASHAMKKSAVNNTGRYRWIIVAGAMFLLMVSMGIVNNCYSLFIIPITTDLGFSRSSYSLCQSLTFLCNMLGAAFGWKLYHRFGLIPTMRIASLTMVVMYFLYSRCHSLVAFYMVSCVLGLCLGLTTTAAVPILLRGWFRERLGLATGVAFMGTGLGGMLFNPIANVLISGSGWQSAYAVLSIIMAVLALPVVFFVFRDNPETGPAALKSSTEKVESLSFAEILHRVGFRGVVLMLMLLAFSVCCTAFIYTITPYLQDIGYSADFASTCASATMAILAVGKLLQGVLLDRLSLRRCTYLAFATTLLGLLALWMFKTPLLLIVVFLGVFLGCPFGTVAVPSLAVSLCSQEAEHGAFIGFFTAIVNLGSAISPILAGAVFDITSSYVPLFIGSAALTCVSIALVRFTISES